MFFEPRNGHGLPHDPTKAIISPRPIGWISTLDENGTPNLGPYSFFNMISSRPPLVWFSSEGPKDSATHAEATGEFVVNLVGRALAEKMNLSAVDAPRGVSEFSYAGLEAEPSTLVKPPRIAGAPAALECKVTEIASPRGLGGAQSDSIVVTGEVVGVYIDDAMLKDGLFDTVAAGNVGRLGYMDYVSVDSIFAMRRPRWDKD
ncbi:MAG: flavin reductase family protein [Rhizobiaceae bacterium]|nr:flavin reductase family protein [Rhizobiaceae bacterium]